MSRENVPLQTQTHVKKKLWTDSSGKKMEQALYLPSTHKKSHPAQSKTQNKNKKLKMDEG